MANRNGVVASCDSISATEIQLDPTKLTQMTGATTFANGGTTAPLPALLTLGVV